uniref:Mpv17-like protein 2 n=2 Tax=Lygus hesperus TaxID=30085 RepID=A0A0A9XQD2_LYGHE
MLLVLAGRFATKFGQVKRVTNRLFSDRYLFVTNIIISASLSGVGDAIEQKLHIGRKKEEEEEFDYVRSKNMCLSGITVGILTHKWYKWLDGKYPGRTLDIVKIKVLLDTLVFSPLQICTFFSTMGLLEKSDVSEVRAEIYEKGRLLYLFEWMVWAPLQVVNFYFLPAKYRVLFDNSFSLVYDIFVSYVKFDRPPEDPPVTRKYWWQTTQDQAPTNSPECKILVEDAN